MTKYVVTFRGDSGKIIRFRVNAPGIIPAMEIAIKRYALKPHKEYYLPVKVEEEN